jgi:hypothetical protein
MSGRAVMRGRIFILEGAVAGWLRKVETEWPRLSVESLGEGVSEIRLGKEVLVSAQASSPVAELQIR